MSLRVPSTLAHLPAFSGVTWFQYAVKLRFCDGLDTPPRNFGCPVAIGGPGGVNGGGGGTVVPGRPLSRSKTVKKTPCRPNANLSSTSPSSRPATWNVRVRLLASTVKRDRAFSAVERRQLDPFPHVALRDSAADDLVARQRESDRGGETVRQDPVGIGRRVLRSKPVRVVETVVVEGGGPDAQPARRARRSPALGNVTLKEITRAAVVGFCPPIVDWMAA